VAAQTVVEACMIEDSSIPAPGGMTIRALSYVMVAGRIIEMTGLAV